MGKQRKNIRRKGAFVKQIIKLCKVNCDTDTTFLPCDKSLFFLRRQIKLQECNLQGRSCEHSIRTNEEIG